MSTYLLVIFLKNRAQIIQLLYIIYPILDNRMII